MGLRGVFLILLTAFVGTAGAVCADDSGDKLTVEQARQYMLELVNRDRKSQGVAPVSLDPVACLAAQSHSDEMAAKGYHGHYDLAGKKPWERYSDQGGTGYVAENTYSLRHGWGVDNGIDLSLVPNATFSKQDIDAAESSLFNEKPPNDGHRKNILDPQHDSLGVGFSLSNAADGYRFNMVHEFTNNKGEFAPLPKQIERDTPITIAGKLPPEVGFYSVIVSWDKLPNSMSCDEISSHKSYELPEKKVNVYWAPPYTSPVPVQLTKVDGQDQFNLTIKPDRSWQPGIYYFEVWVKPKGKGDPMPTSMRTARLLKS